MTHDACIFAKLGAIYVISKCPRWLRRQTWLPCINAGTNPDQNFYLLLISCCFTSINFGLKARIFLIIKWLKVLFWVDISKILVHAVIPHDSALLFILRGIAFIYNRKSKVNCNCINCASSHGHLSILNFTQRGW